MKTIVITAILMTATAQVLAASSSEQTCRACHSMETKLVGPPFKEIAAFYRNDSNALAHLKKSMLEGSSGRWGTVAMPPNTGLTEAEAEQFSHWIMSLDAGTAAPTTDGKK